MNPPIADGVVEVSLRGLTPGTGYSQLDLYDVLPAVADDTSLGRARDVQRRRAAPRSRSSIWRGRSRWKGRSPDLPEGGTLLVDGQTFRITYRGGRMATTSC